MCFPPRLWWIAHCSQFVTKMYYIYIVGVKSCSCNLCLAFFLFQGKVNNFFCATHQIILSFFKGLSCRDWRRREKTSSIHTIVFFFASHCLFLPMSTFCFPTLRNRCNIMLTRRFLPNVQMFIPVLPS